MKHFGETILILVNYCIPYNVANLKVFFCVIGGRSKAKSYYLKYLGPGGVFGRIKHWHDSATQRSSLQFSKLYSFDILHRLVKFNFMFFVFPMEVSVYFNRRWHSENTRV